MKKLKYALVRRKLEDLGLEIFTPLDLQQIFGASLRAVEAFLSYHKKANNLIRLKKGYYCFADKKPVDFLIANKVYSPSYISLETALSYYQIIPEVVYSITSITTRKTNRFIILDKEFIYRSVKKEAFLGYKVSQIGIKTRVNIALPEKALADYLYFCFLEKKQINERIKKTGLIKSSF